MDLFTQGQKITLFFQKNQNMVEMSCSIDAIFDDRLILVLPQYFMRYVEFLQVGMKLTAKAFSKIGTIDFNTVIIASPLEELFTIELDRNSLKINSNEDIAVVDATEILDVVQGNSVNRVKTFKISPEFIKFTSNKPYKINDNIDCILNLPKDYGIIEFKATITEIDPIYDTEYTAVYTTMTEKSRQTLLYFMYIYSRDIS